MSLGRLAKNHTFAKGMKFFTLLLTTVILFLVAKPGLDLVSMQNETEQSCCAGNCKRASENENSPNEENQKNDSNGNTCNPFQSCCPWVFNFPTKAAVEPLNPEISSQQDSRYQSAFTSQFAPDFWQPPKIA